MSLSGNINASTKGGTTMVLAILITLIPLMPLILLTALYVGVCDRYEKGNWRDL